MSKDKVVKNEVKAVPAGASVETRLAAVEAELKTVSYIVRKHFQRGKTLAPVLLAILMPSLAFGQLGGDNVQKYNGTNGASVAITKAGAIVASGSVTASSFSGGISGAVAATTITASGATTLSSSLTVIGGSVTSRWDNGSSKIDGEMIADDTIDDDSIDFSDVTGADLTLTDCGTITASGILTVSNSVYMGHPSIWKTITSDGGRVDVPTALGAVTNGQVIAGLSTFHTVAPVGTVTNTIAVPTVAGRVMTIINIAAQSFNLDDSGTLKLAGAADLNQYDSITLRAIDTSTWVEVGRSNN